ncbi:MAG: lipopolysaccharide biosynthesis protein [Ardenticatenaceae bacterium]
MLDNSKQVARKSVHGVFWNYVSFGVGKVLVFVTTAILARLLTPNDFGIVAFATLAISYLAILKDLGMGAALIQRRQDVDAAANTVFTLNLLLGVSLTLIAMAMAPLIARFFREPLVIPILRWLSLSFTLNALGAIHIVRLQRELEFRRKLIPDLGRSLVKGIVSLGLAWGGFGVWALVVGQLSGILAGVILVWGVFPWRPRLTINTALVRELLSYGLSVVSLDALSVVTNNLDYLIVGRVFGNVALGIYTLAYRLPELLVLNLLWVMGRTLFPAFSSVQERPDALRQGFLTALRFVEMLIVPLCLGMILTADPLVRLVFGQQWLEVIPIVRVLALFAMVRSIGSNVGDVYKAIGRPDILVKLGLLSLVIYPPALWFGSYFGLVGVAWAHVTVGSLATVARLIVATRVVKITFGDIFTQLKPALLSSIALIVLALPALYLTVDAKPQARLLVVGVAGATGYISTLWRLERESLLHTAKLINWRNSKT